MSILHCPNCKNSYLHQGDVEVFNGEEKGSSVFVSRKGCSTHSFGENEIGGNPSFERNGLLMRFRCEHCNEPLVLSIYQHEGQTFIEWQGKIGENGVLLDE